MCHNVSSNILVFFATNSARMNLLKQKWNNKSLWNSNKKKKENFSLQSFCAALLAEVFPKTTYWKLSPRHGKLSKGPTVTQLVYDEIFHSEDMSSWENYSNLS